ncbi:unnamed protein product [Effrenium voratum]|uniref:Uncharacterized protein n=1 Tax=Effrenium voratum TaxID=2562239 RepID=A0AA36HP34_9DINO|nr:unnamed protein product [Effrenium voratum]
MRPPVQTRVTFDEETEVLLIDTVGDILMDNAQYRVLLHLKEDRQRDRPLSDLFGYSVTRFFKEQKFALLVTGIRPHQPGISGISDRMRGSWAQVRRLEFHPS